jgi:hypothetical protein
MEQGGEMSFKREGGSRVDPYDCKRLFKKLPHTLKTFDLWFYTSAKNNEGEAAGLREYHLAVGRWLREQFGNDPQAPSSIEVAAAGGLTYEVWYRHMLTRGDRHLMPVK